MPYPAAIEHPESTPCVKKVRGSSDGVREAAKNSVPSKRPPLENECQSSLVIARDRLVTIVRRDTVSRMRLNGAYRHRKHERQADADPEHVQQRIASKRDDARTYVLQKVAERRSSSWYCRRIGKWCAQG